MDVDCAQFLNSQSSNQDYRLRWLSSMRAVYSSYYAVIVRAPPGGFLWIQPLPKQCLVLCDCRKLHLCMHSRLERISLHDWSGCLRKLPLSKRGHLHQKAEGWVWVHLHQGVRGCTVQYKEEPLWPQPLPELRHLHPAYLWHVQLHLRVWLGWC